MLCYPTLSQVATHVERFYTAGTRPRPVPWPLTRKKQRGGDSRHPRNRRPLLWFPQRRARACGAKAAAPAQEQTALHTCTPHSTTPQASQQARPKQDTHRERADSPRPAGRLHYSAPRHRPTGPPPLPPAQQADRLGLRLPGQPPSSRRRPAQQEQEQHPEPLPQRQPATPSTTHSRSASVTHPHRAHTQARRLPVLGHV
jgi:hypothetical protein